MIINSLYKFGLAVCLMVVECMPILVNVQGTELYYGIGKIPANETWYICSADNTNYIAYDIQQVSNGQKETPNFNIIVQGNRPPSFPDQLGILTYVTNYTGLQLFIDPSHPNSSFYNNISCWEEPRIRCYQKTNPAFKIKDILCLSVVNPHNNVIKFSYSISYSSGLDATPTISSDTGPAYKTIGPDGLDTSIMNSVKPTTTPHISRGSDVGSSGTGIWWVLMGVGVASSIFTFLLS